jgi:hypothetical protein
VWLWHRARENARRPDPAQLHSSADEPVRVIERGGRGVLVLVCIGSGIGIETALAPSMNKVVDTTGLNDKLHHSSLKRDETRSYKVSSFHH